MFNLNAVDEGFSRKAEVYDAYCENHPVVRWAREVVRDEVISRLRAQGSILELNAGTGSDAAHFVQKGYRVHATDVASGMIEAIRRKMEISGAGDRFSVQQMSFTELDHVVGAPYDLVFSNFGGLNCISDLREVTRSLVKLLKPGGHVVWVIMPIICPWELAQILRRQFRVALRRLNPKGTLANVEGARIQTWYHSPAKIKKSFPPGFLFVDQRSVSLFCPPSYMDNFPHRFPRLTKFLFELDGSLGVYFPFRNWGDFVMYTFRYEP